jgi:uncharacterized membrane protein YeaQ/YmgE (transglycosylase-associated protein family)
MTILGWIVLGGLAGWVAAVLMHERQGCLMNIIVGVVGAVIGGVIFNLLGGIGVTGFNLWSFAVALVGAVILLGLVRALSPSHRSQR